MSYSDLLLTSAAVRRKKAELDLAWFARYYLDEYFRTRITDFHKEWIQILSKDQNAVLAAPRGHAKAQSLESKVLTIGGWCKLGELEVGDYVIGGDGKPAKVLQTHPITEMDLYKVETRDGRKTLCNLDHLWNVQCPSNTGDRVITKPLSEIVSNYAVDRLDKRNGQEYVEYRYFLPTIEPIKFEAKLLPIDPYTFGYWLGDGTSANGNVTTADPEIFDYIPYDYTKNKSKCRYNIHGLKTRLRKSGLLNNKHIPEIYLYASIEQRQSLLQGLMDSDGNISSDGMQLQFTNKNEVLINDFISLIRGLGGTATKGITRTRFDKDSEYKLSYKVTARIPKSVMPCKLRRKMSKWKGSIKTKAAITNVSYSHRGLGRCITVERDTYVTDDYMLTHNSTYFTLLKPLHSILFQKHKYILIISDTIGQAEEKLGSIAKELETNERIIKDFGNIAGFVPKEAKEKERWTTKEIVTTTGIKVQAFGWKTKFRGIKHGAYRPDLIIIDDIENDENVWSDIQRAKLKDIINKSIFNLGTSETQYYVIGTILHFASYLQNMMLNPPNGWFHKLYKAIVDDKPLWPEWWSIEKLEEQKALIGPIAFEQEFMNNPLNADQQILKPKAFYTEVDFARLDFYGFMDLAISEKQTADYTAIVVTGKHRDTGKLYHVYSERLRGGVEKQLELAFRIHQRFKLKLLGIESVAYQKAFAQILAREARLTHRYIPAMEIEVDRDKIRRAIAVTPYIENETVLFDNNQKEFLLEVQQFPLGEHDDYVDAFVGCVQLVTKGSGSGKISTGRSDIYRHEAN